MDLLARFTELGRRARRLGLLRAVGWLVCGSLISLIGLSVIDASFRPRDPWIMLLPSLLWWSGLVGSTIALLLPVWSSKIDPLWVAGRLEQAFPALRDRLVGAISFLLQHGVDLGNGSRALRERVVNEATTECRDIDFLAALDDRPARRAWSYAGIALVATCGLGLIFAQEAVVAVPRVIAPWLADDWPRANLLELLDAPTRLTPGQTFSVRVVDRLGMLPPDLVALVREQGPNGETQTTELPLPSDSQTVLFRRDAVARDFEYRIVGGDDETMPWQRLRIVDSARLRDLELRVIPPAYSGLPASLATSPVRVLRGTRVALSGRSDEALRSARVRIGEQRIPLHIESSGNRFTTDRPWIIDDSLTAMLEVENESGIVTIWPESWEFRVVPDARPTVEWIDARPEIAIVPDGIFSVAAIAKDDLAITLAELSLNGEDRQALAQPIRLDQATSPRTLSLAEPARITGRRPEHRLTLERELDLTPYGLLPGRRLLVVLAVQDGAGNRGESSARTIEIVAPEEMIERFETQYVGIIEELFGLAIEQRATREHVERLLANDRSIVAWQAVAERQRRVSNVLGSRSPLAAKRLRELADELRRNRLARTPLAVRVEAVRATLAALDAEALPQIDAALGEILRIAEQDATMSFQPYAARLLAAQNRVVIALSSLKNESTDDSTMADLERRLAELIRSQKLLHADTESQADITPGKRPDQLSEEELNSLRNLSARQAATVGELERITGGFTELSLKPDRPASGGLTRLLSKLRGDDPAGLLRAAALALERNRINQAADFQIAALRILESLASEVRADSTTTNPIPDRNTEIPPAASERTPPVVSPELAKLRAAIELLVTAQQDVLRESTRLEATRSTNGDIPTQESVNLKTVAGKQSQIAGETESLAAESVAAPVFEQALRTITERMQAAAARLLSGRTDAATAQLQTDALKRLLALRAGLQPRPPQAAPKSPPGKNGDNQSAEQSPRITLTPLQTAELRVIRNLQIELNKRTDELMNNSADGRPNADNTQAIGDLASEQERLRELLLRLVPRPASSPETTRD